MAFATTVPQTAPLLQRAFFKVPLLGWWARDITYGDSDNILWAGGSYVCLWLSAALTWGLPALSMGALLLVPVIFMLLLAIT